MKTRGLLLTAAAGLACGFLIRAGRQASADAPPTSLLVSADKVPALSGPEAEAAADLAWNSRITALLADASLPASPTTPGERGLRAEADALLRLLRRPVTEDSIREGLAELNARSASSCYEYIAAICERWAAEAPEAALAAADCVQNPRWKTALVWKVFQRTAGEPDVLSRALALPRGAMRSAAIAGLAESVSPERAAGLLRESLKAGPPGALNESSGSPQAVFLRKLAAADKEAPLRLALETEDPAWRAALLRQCSGLAEAPLENERFTELMRDPRNLPGLRDVLEGRLFWKTKECLPLVAGLPDADRHKILTGTVSWALYTVTEEKFRGQSQESNWEGSLRDMLADEEKRGGSSGVRSLLAESALERGAEGLANTARWLTSQGDAAGVDDLTRRAAHSEPFTTARWLASQPSSPERDRAAAVFAEVHASADPESAAAWAESIADPAAREAALASVRKQARR